MKQILPTTAVLLAVALAPAFAHAQTCTSAWLPSDATIYGTSGTVNATIPWDPDGPGPASTVLVVGGNFRYAGGITANNLATFDPATGVWTGLGLTSTGVVKAFTVAPDGSLVFAASSGITRWNGLSFSNLGFFSSSSSVDCVAAMPNGDIIAGGTFFTGSGTYISRWNGSAWAPIGTGMNNPVRALAVMPSGDLIAGGTFTTAGGVAAQRLARWNGTAWSAIATSCNNNVNALAVAPNGDLIVGGEFTNLNSTPMFAHARWNGTIWSSLGVPAGSGAKSLAVLPSGDVLSTTTTSGFIQRWNGSSWTQLGSIFSTTLSATPSLFSLSVMPDGTIFTGGAFLRCGEVDARNVARWSGTLWENTGGIGISGDIYSFAVKPSGDVVAAGLFSHADNQPCGNVAVRSGGAWSTLGSGFNGLVRSVCIASNGDILAAGDFTLSGATPVNRVARWNGSAWQPMGSGMDAPVYAILQHSGGDVYAGGLFTTAADVPANRVARWNGTAWIPLNTGLSGSIYALAELADKSVVAGGLFAMNIGSTTTSNIARWDGSNWGSLATSFPTGAVLTLAMCRNGDLVVGGGFGNVGTGSSPSYVAANRVALLRDRLWFPMESAMVSGIQVNSVAELPGGGIVAGGNFTSAGSANSSSPDDGEARYIARWDDYRWRRVGRGTNYNDLGVSTLPDVRAVAVLPNGNFIIGGAFTSVNSPGNGAANLLSPAFAEWSTSLPVFDTQPTDVSTCPGTDAAFSAPLATPGATYQWYHNDFPIDATANTTAASSTLVVLNVQAAEEGEYRCVATGACGTASSSTVTLTLKECSTGTCDDIDFNNDGLYPDTTDIDAFLSVFSGGGCF